MEEKSNGPPSKFINKVMFIFFGIASLLGWNALLTKLDFFNYFLSDIKPFRSFAFLNFILDITFQFLLIWKKNLFPLLIEIIIGTFGSILFLVLVPLSASLLGKNEMINKVITSGLVVIMGFINALIQGGFFSYAGHFPLEMIVLFNIGQGISAISLNIIEFIVLASVNIEDGEKELVVKAWIFFGFAILILLISFFLLFYSYRDDYCKYYLFKADNKSLNESNKETKMMQLYSVGEENNKELSETEMKEQITKINEENTGEKFEPKFSYVFKKVWDLDLLICYGYIVTFALFPGVSTDQRIFDIGEYNSVTIITIYNVCDTVGRYLVSLMKQSKKLNLIVMLGRSILLFTLIFNDYLQFSLEANLTFTSIFLIINVILLGLTNGIGATLTFGLASSLAEDEIKKQTGGSIGFFCIFGIFLGSCLAFGTGAIIDTFKK